MAKKETISLSNHDWTPLVEDESKGLVFWGAQPAEHRVEEGHLFVRPSSKAAATIKPGEMLCRADEMTRAAEKSE